MMEQVALSEWEGMLSMPIAELVFMEARVCLHHSGVVENNKIGLKWKSRNKTGNEERMRMS
jgi:hypothetical protein